MVVCNRLITIETIFSASIISQNNHNISLGITVYFQFAKDHLRDSTDG